MDSPHYKKSIYIPDATWGAEIAHGIICMHNPGWLHAAGLDDAKTESSFAGRTQAGYESGCENTGNYTCLETRLGNRLKQDN